jgi:hypothetical protein
MTSKAGKIRHAMKFIINFNIFYSKNEFLFTHITCKNSDGLPSCTIMGGKKKRITRKRRIIENKKRITKRNKKKITKRNKKKLKRGKSIKYIKF